MCFLIRIIRNILKRLAIHRINAGAAYATLYLIMAFFPLIMFLASILRYTPLTQSDLMSAFSYITPNVLDAFLADILNELYAKSDIRILSITAIATLWSASKGIYGIMIGLNIIFETPEKRNYIRRKLCSFVYTFLFVLSLTITLGLFVFGNYLHLMIERMFPLIGQISLLILNLRSIIAAIILVIFFSMLYAFIPNRKNHLLKQIPGACLASVGWMGFSYLFSIYMNHFSNFSYIYGSLTAVVLLILWLYVCMYLLFVGAEFNRWLEESDHGPEKTISSCIP